MRLFFAILLEDSVKNELCHMMEQLERHSVQGRFTRRENLHLTLAFLGETNRMEAAERAMRQAVFQPFFLELERLGRFRRDEGDILWAGVKKNAALMGLQKELAAALMKEDFLLENRPYRPHLTLGRQVVWRDGPLPLMQPVKMLVSRFHLMKSERTDGTLTYTSIAVRESEDALWS